MLGFLHAVAEAPASSANILAISHREQRGPVDALEFYTAAQWRRVDNEIDMLRYRAVNQLAYKWKLTHLLTQCVARLARQSIAAPMAQSSSILRRYNVQAATTFVCVRELPLYCHRLYLAPSASAKHYYIDAPPL